VASHTRFNDDQPLLKRTFLCPFELGNSDQLKLYKIVPKQGSGGLNSDDAAFMTSDDSVQIYCKRKWQKLQYCSLKLVFPTSEPSNSKWQMDFSPTDSSRFLSGRKKAFFRATDGRFAISCENGTCGLEVVE